MLYCWAFVRRFHRSPGDYPHRGPIKRKIFPCINAIMPCSTVSSGTHQRTTWVKSDRYIFQTLLSNNCIQCLQTIHRNWGSRYSYEFNGKVIIFLIAIMDSIYAMYLLKRMALSSWKVRENRRINPRPAGMLSLQNKNHAFGSDIDLVTQNIQNTFSYYLLKSRVIYIMLYIRIQTINIWCVCVWVGGVCMSPCTHARTHDLWFSDTPVPTHGDGHYAIHSLTHSGRVTHIWIGKLTNIGSDNGLSPGRRQAIIWSNAASKHGSP